MASNSETPAERPDWAFLANRGMADGGPRYTETPVDPFAPNARFVAEPWNTITAALFILLVGVWVWRLRGRYRDYPFLCCCLPILLAGGIGGTLYHATRTSFAFFLLDVVPISILGLAGAVFMAIRYWGRHGWWFVPGATAFYVGVNGLLFAALDPGQTLAVNLSYAALAIVVLTPIALVLVRTKFRHGGWIVAGVVAFVIAWCFRLVDRRVELMLPMGSHWLWHTFGAIATAFLIEYFYRVGGERKTD
ncbi:MAG: hypothetical protein C0467_11520 [Planctomycetaceae bacterium]|nr:hypothetical protein [Planctomycetaceae bacterium]